MFWSSSASSCGDPQGACGQQVCAGPVDNGHCNMGGAARDMSSHAVGMGGCGGTVAEDGGCAPAAPPQKCYNTVTMFRMEPYQAQEPYKKTVMVEKTVPTIECKQVPRQVPTTKQVTQTVDEPYIKTVSVQVPTTKKVQKSFTVSSTRQVFEMVKVPTTVSMPVQKWVDDVKTVTKYKTVPYQVQVPTKRMITVQEQRESFKMEKVSKTVPYQKTEMRWVDVPSMKTVTKQVPATRQVKRIITVPTTRTIMETVKVAGTKTVKMPETVDAMRCVTKYRRVPYQKSVEVPCPMPEPVCPAPEPMLCPMPEPTSGPTCGSHTCSACC